MTLSERGVANSIRIFAFAKAHPEIDALDFDAIIDLLLKMAGF